MHERGGGGQTGGTTSVSVKESFENFLPMGESKTIPRKPSIQDGGQYEEIIAALKDAQQQDFKTGGFINLWQQPQALSGRTRKRRKQSP